MNGLLKGVGGVIVVLVMVAFCISMLAIPSCATLIIDVSELPSDDDGPPSNGTCDNVGLVYPDNPFSGWPVQGGANWGLVTAYYCDPAYFEQFGANHYGIDLAYPQGTPVVATASGTIASAGFHDLMGLYVRVCTNNWCSTYMHLSSILVDPNSNVTAGEILGLVGSTGNSTGAHLHYQINDPDWNTVDPAPTMN